MKTTVIILVAFATMLFLTPNQAQAALSLDSAYVLTYDDSVNIGVNYTDNPEDSTSLYLTYWPEGSTTNTPTGSVMIPIGSGQEEFVLAGLPAGSKYFYEIYAFNIAFGAPYTVYAGPFSFSTPDEPVASTTQMVSLVNPDFGVVDVYFHIKCNDTISALLVYDKGPKTNLNAFSPTTVPITYPPMDDDTVVTLTLDTSYKDTVSVAVLYINSDLTSGSSDTMSTIIQKVLVSVEDDLEASRGEVSVYPNPASTVINIIGDGIAGSIFTLCDMSGRMITETTIEGKEFEFSVSNLPSGVYLYRIDTKRIIKYGKLEVH